MHNMNPLNCEMKAVNFKSFPKNTLVGFFDLETPTGMVLRGCTLHRRDGHRWVGFPAKPYEKDGKQSWAAIIDFTSKEIERAFQNAALAAAEVAANG